MLRRMGLTGERGQKRELAKATLIFLPLPVRVRRR